MNLLDALNQEITVRLNALAGRSELLDQLILFCARNLSIVLAFIVSLIVVRGLQQVWAYRPQLITTNDNFPVQRRRPWRIGNYSDSRDLQAVFYLAISGGLVICLNLIIHQLYPIARPFIADPNNTYQLFTLVVNTPQSAFPSDHAALAMVIALGVSRWLEIPFWQKLTLFALVYTVSLARVIAGLHYIQDVLAGWLLALLAVWIVQKMQQGNPPVKLFYIAKAATVPKLKLVLPKFSVALTNGYSQTLLAGIIGLSLLFRLPVLLFNDSLRLDESFSLNTIKESPWEILEHSINGSNPPLYSLLLKGWTSIFGASEIAIRSLSTLLGILAVFCLFELARQVYDVQVAYWVGLLGAVAPLWIWYSAEARTYSLWLVLACLHSLFFFRLVRQPSFFYVSAYAFSGILLIYTQYFGLILSFTHVGYLLLTWRKNRQLIWWLGIAGCLMALAFLPWLTLLLTNRTGDSSPSLPSPDFRQMFNIAAQLLTGFTTDSLPFLIIEPIIQTIIVGCVLIVGVLLVIYYKTGQLNSHTIFFLISPIIVVGFFMTISFLRSVLEVRYLLFISPYILLVFGKTLYQFGKPARRGLVAASIVLVFGVAAFFQTTDNANQARVDYRAAANYLATQVKPTDVIVLDAYFIRPALDYYQPNWNAPIVYAPSPRELSREPSLLNKRLNFSANTSYIWVVQSYWNRPEDANLAYLNTNYKLVSAKQFSPELLVLCYRS